MNSLQGLALLCGICLVCFGRADGFQDIPDNLSKAINKLNDHFNVNDKALFGNPIFLKDLTNGDVKYEESEQKLLLHEILEVYDSILADMLNRTQDEDLKGSIEEVKHQLDKQRRSYFHHKEHALKKRLQDLWAMKTSDAVVQRKAVRELGWVIQRVVEVMTKKPIRQHRRRRRQISRAQLGRKSAF
ncbi:interferon gamma 1-like [Megalops cyprinoides]|uniref:interferon gamma 1-like n=1 Tax=Megalops cyprinoides TaxID=118141 RepID=UPI00186525F1|nr:interferon gamma 1-like [Megalops cyprinoides]